MSSTFVADLKQRFAGQLSEGEKILCSTFLSSIHATVNGQQSFEREMRVLWNQLQRLRKFNFDVDEAAASGEFDPGIQEPSQEDQTPRITPAVLSSAEKSFLEDTLGLIDWVVRNGVRFSLLLEVLGHDIGEIARHDFSLEKAMADFVRPKVTGWAKRNSDPVGEAEDQN